MKRITAALTTITATGGAIASSAIVTGITGAVVTSVSGSHRFDDPVVWAAAALGIAAAHWRIPTVPKPIAIANGLTGVGLSAFGSAWATSLLSVPLSDTAYSAPPVPLVAFLIAMGWGWVFKLIAPVVTSSVEALKGSIVSRIKSWGKK